MYGSNSFTSAETLGDLGAMVAATLLSMEILTLGDLPMVACVSAEIVEWMLACFEPGLVGEDSEAEWMLTCFEPGLVMGRSRRLNGVVK